MQEIIAQSIDRHMKETEETCPYDHTPNKRLQKALENVEMGKNLVRCKDVADLFKKLRS